MKRLLLLGGMTPDVTALYYASINRHARDRLGGRRSAPLHLYSADLHAMVDLASAGDWDDFAASYVEGAGMHALAGRFDAVVVCAILAHKATRQIVHALSTLPNNNADGAAAPPPPLLHIADCVASHLRAQHPDIRALGLLGPKITMEDVDDPDFFAGRLAAAGYEVVVPEAAADRDEVNRGMMEEVVRGAAAVTQGTRAMFVEQARALARRGAGAIILGSTDLGFVVTQEDLGDDVVIIEPAAIHAAEAARWALEE
ncbi:hypothetical protein N3K66_007451 [Trichothecium roseum]|uniref:Uncharacterized protein n=1 Tax=Trichothecium roseum TaxID=47278 RepID=A0ACC0UU22_9HYPO|nr:hypothetical protein N3K66_007451 [Trichothecium roseum]